MKIKYLALFTALILVNLVFANDYRIEKWQIADVKIKSKKSVADPFRLIIGAEFKHENGITMNVPAFYNGNNEWVVRVSPSLEGVWAYTTYSENSTLAGLKGNVTVSANTKPNRHGPIIISEKNKQRFSYEDGTTYFPLAFEIDWLFALDAEYKNDIPRTRQIVSDLVANRFNKLIMNVYAYDAGWGEREKVDPKYNFSKPAVFPFGGTNERPDYSTLNISFFNHFDRVMDHLHDNELVSHLMIYVWNKFVNWPKPGSEEDNLYFDYVVKRYQAYPNLLWDISKEALAYGMDDMDYIVDRIARFKKLDGHNRLMTVHDYNFCNEYPNLVDFISIQEWKPNLYNQMQDVVKKHDKKPVFNVEHGGYEFTMHTIFHGAYTDSIKCLERSYECLFAGTYTTYYWQNASWYELVYEPFTLEKEKQPRFYYYKHLMDFFDQYDFNELVPDQFFYSTYCLTNQKDVYLYLMTNGMYALEGSPHKNASNKQVEVQWFNPLTGEYSAIESRKIGEWTAFKKPQSITSPFSIAIMKVVE